MCRRASSFCTPLRIDGTSHTEVHPSIESASRNTQVPLCLGRCGLRNKRIFCGDRREAQPLARSWGCSFHFERKPPRRSCPRSILTVTPRNPINRAGPLNPQTFCSASFFFLQRRDRRTHRAPPTNTPPHSPLPTSQRITERDAPPRRAPPPLTSGRFR